MGSFTKKASVTHKEYAQDPKMGLPTYKTRLPSSLNINNKANKSGNEEKSV